MAEYKFNAQVNYGWGLSLNMTGKAPAVAKRIFSTYADALAYVNDYNDSAIEGLALAVFADTDTKKNGLYFVAKIGTSTTNEETGVTSANNDGVLVKLETAGAADGSISDINTALAAVNAEIGDPSSVGEGDVIVPSSGLYKVIEDAAENAASDATSKANSAEANAKSYADGKVNELKSSLSNALHFLGVSSTDPSTGIVTIGGTEVTEFSDGDIVIFGSKEFVWSNAAWEELGDVTGVSELLTWNEEEKVEE